MDARLGYAKRDTVGRDGENSGIGPRSCSPMWVWWRSTCRGDRDASFNWAIVAKRQRRRWTGELIATGRIETVQVPLQPGPARGRADDLAAGRRARPGRTAHAPARRGTARPPTAQPGPARAAASLWRHHLGPGPDQVEPERPARPRLTGRHRPSGPTLGERQVRDVQNEEGQLHHVTEARPDLRQAAAQVLEHLPRLRRRISGPDQFTALVLRDLAAHHTAGRGR